MYLQYSTRDQIINSTTKTGEAAGNVILVSLENLDVRPLSRSKLAKRHLRFSGAPPAPPLENRRHAGACTPLY